MDNVNEDYSNFLLVIQDSPAVEAIHNRCVGAKDAILDAFPDIPADRIVELDCGASLTEDHLDKMGSTIQAYKDDVDVWISVAERSSISTYSSLFSENGVDIANNTRILDCFSTPDPINLMLADPAVATAGYGYGLVPYPSGVGMVELLHDLFENGTPIPAFSPYDLIVVKEDTVQEYYDNYIEE